LPRCLVTGGNGFVGAALLHRLVSQGHQPAVLLRDGADTARIDDIIGRLQVIRGTLSDLEKVRAAVDAYRPDTVVHLAWSGVAGAERNALQQTDNLAFSLDLYRLARDIGAQTFIGLGSQAEYGPCPAIIDETVPCQPTTLYGATKVACFLLLQRLAALDGLRFVWLRLFSSYGPGDDPRWLISYLIRKLMAGERPSLTACEQRWDYIHVDDVAAAIAASVGGNAAGVFNLGSGEARPLREIVSLVRDQIDPSLPLGFGEVPYRDDQVMHLQANIAALSDAFGWRPHLTLEQGIRDTVAWHKNHMNAV